MTTKTQNTKANTTARKAKKTTKAPAAKPATKNAPMAERDVKESRRDAKKINKIDAAMQLL